MLQEQEVDFAADVPSLADTMVDVTGSAEVPGLLHIIHNAGRSLEGALMFFSEAVPRLTKVSPMLSKKENKDRIQIYLNIIIVLSIINIFTNICTEKIR